MIFIMSNIVMFLWRNKKNLVFIYHQLFRRFSDVLNDCCFFSATCPSSLWLSRTADSGGGSNCYLLTPYNNDSVTMTQSEAADYCTQQAVSDNAVPALLSVNSQAEKASQDSDFVIALLVGTSRDAFRVKGTPVCLNLT